jgi:hypothetical protein
MIEIHNEWAAILAFVHWKIYMFFFLLSPFFQPILPNQDANEKQRKTNNFISNNKLSTQFACSLPFLSTRRR